MLNTQPYSIEEEKDYPAIAVIGGSGEGKSTAIAGLCNPDFQGSMLLFAGEGNTTSCLSRIVINPVLNKADIVVKKFKNRDEIRVELERHFKTSLVSELKNCLSSRPKKESEHGRFYADAVEKKLSPIDATFRIDKLLQGFEDAWVRYKDIMVSSIEFIDKQADSSFRSNYFDCLKEEKNEANRMIDTLVDQKMFPHEESVDNVVANNTISQMLNELCDLVYDKALDCLRNAGFHVDESSLAACAINKTSEGFKLGAQAVTNSKRVIAPSAACIIKEMVLRVPGPGLLLNNGLNETAYCVYDVVGFDNDGIDKIPERVKEALLTPVLYDAILFVRSTASPAARNRDYLTAIKQSVRPSKLLVAVTHFDRTSIFEQDEDPTPEKIQKQISQIKNDTIDLIESVIDLECPVKLPDKPDIICFANTARKNRLGEDAVAFFRENDPYQILRISISKAFVQVRPKIKDHNIHQSQKGEFLLTKEPLNEIIGQIINGLTSSINEEYSVLRDRSNKLHHWTVDAVLWNLYQGRPHVSYAQIWENVSIQTFSNFIRICMENLTPSKIEIGVQVGKYSDRVKLEFESNLKLELNHVARKIFLETGDYSQTVSCKETILQLARTSKYNKWKIFDDLRKCLLTAVSQQNYLKDLLDSAVENANVSTYSRLFL
ncbi:hypothetical protein QW71_09800 [Paenibacillus sp. IHB B 3415]|uniref:hypothetical protein n=1 Tax=Paenibacillus sp. IHB B 3415 TaxID=867080 RepID=UPI0005736E19|nr:hypothetical protein [Paenibacillus sp. IHB B 3415]KHL95892.1 hypothetical protein QW71_09800 [Paenibacillus sp. IHB B 3415]